MVKKLTVQQLKFYLLLMKKISQEACNDCDSYCETTRSTYKGMTLSVEKTKNKKQFVPQFPVTLDDYIFMGL